MKSHDCDFVSRCEYAWVLVLGKGLLPGNTVTSALAIQYCNDNFPKSNNSPIDVAS